jgi:hypothetical protein
MLLVVILLKGTFTSFFKNKKVTKKSQNSRNQGFSSYFCLMIEGYGSRPGPLTNRSRRVTNKRIRIRNTGIKYYYGRPFHILTPNCSLRIF